MTNELNYKMTPDIIIDNIESLPSISIDDAARILAALRDTFPSLEF